METTAIKIMPSALDGLTTETRVHSFASNILTVTLANGEELDFYGSSDDTMFAETFGLTDAAGNRFAFTPGDVAASVEQIKAAVQAGYSNLQRFG